MRRHDVELIVALAEGRLENEAEARALIATSPQARAAYEAQVQALGALEALKAPIAMTENEKATMQRDIWTSLTTESAPRKTQKTSPALLGYGTAAIFVVAGLFLAMNLLGSESGASTASDNVSTRATTEGAAPSQTPDLSTEGLERLSALADRARTGVLIYTDFAEAASEDLHDCLEDAGLFGYASEGVFSDAGVTYLVAIPTDTEIGPTSSIAIVDRGSCTVAYRED